MSFLHRRRSFIPTQPFMAPLTAPSTPFPPAVENISTSQPSTVSSTSGKTSRPSLLITRVSTLFSNRKKRRSNITPLVNVRHDSDSSQRWQISSDDHSVAESESVEDIRRPSGLGRAISLSSKRSLPPSPFTAIDEESPFHVAVNGFQKARSLSSPNLLRSMTGKSKFKASSHSLTVNKTDRDHSSFITRIPNELLVVILSFLPHHTVAGIAMTCRDFCTAARIVLYRRLDLRTFGPRQIERLISLLAFRTDLTDIVHTLECHTWPSFFPPDAKTNHIQPPSFSPTLTATFTIAFQNMHQITTLILPSFDKTFLRHHSAFGLKKTTFLCTTMSAAETMELFTWLDGQTNITHLAFPNLVEQVDPPAIPRPRTDTHNNQPILKTDSHSLNNNTASVSSHTSTPSCSPVSPFPFLLSPTTPVSPFNSSTLLPGLTTLEAPPSIVTSLASSRSSVPSRPLDHVILSINTTLYAGLRPNALITSLQGITNLKLKFGPGADKRTLGKLLSAAGAGLTGDGVKDLARPGLQVLQIEVPDSETNTDQALYKIINTVLSRYQGLLSLQLRFSPDQTSSHDQSTSTAELDDAMVMLWRRHCPSLQSITLLSGAIWHSGTWIV